jgi:hypothetical protein
MIGGHGGNIHELGRRLGCSPADITDLSSNVNPLGPPPGLREFLGEQLDAITALPEVDNRGTIQSYAEFLGISADRILAGNGTTQFIYSIPRGLSVKEALISGPTYSDYADACRLQGVAPRYCLALERQSFRPDIDRLEKEIGTADTVFICNPNNPPGALIDAADIERLPPAPAGAFHRGRVLPSFCRGRRETEPRPQRAGKPDRAPVDLEDFPHPRPAGRIYRRPGPGHRRHGRHHVAMERQRPRAGGCPLRVR